VNPIDEAKPMLKIALIVGVLLLAAGHAEDKTAPFTTLNFKRSEIEIFRVIDGDCVLYVAAGMTAAGPNVAITTGKGCK
jgi:hypothetical protein